MALPIKKKFDIEVINPIKVGNEYMKYGLDRIEELMINTDKKTNYLPRTIQFEDTDTEIFNDFKDGKFQLIVDGKIVPTFYLENERWGEFSKTWKFMDEDKNVPTPYITVRRTGKKEGTRLGTKYRIPQPRNFRYLDVPILDDGQVINLRFKIPEPVNVDLLYEVRLFTKYRVDFNAYDEQVFRNFASRQAYIFVKGTPFPVHLESIEEANTIENIDGDRFYVGVYNIKVLSYIQNEKEFEIVKTSRKPKLRVNVSNKNFKTLNIKGSYVQKRVSFSIIDNTYKLNKSYATISNHFDNISGMIAAENTLKRNAIYYVADASGDPNITSGYAYYEFIAKINSNISDFRLLSSENVTTPLTLKDYTWIATENQTKYTMSGVSANEIFEIDDVLVGNVRQINNYVISTENVSNDSFTIDIGNGNIPANTMIYLQYYTKNT